MTLDRRIAIAKTLTMIQFVLSVTFSGISLLILGILVYVAFRDGVLPFPLVWMVITAVVVLFFLSIGIALPWIVLHAFKVRNERWGTAAIVSLIAQVVLGGGAFSIFPIVTLILLLNKEASAYIGVK